MLDVCARGCRGVQTSKHETSSYRVLSVTGQNAALHSPYPGSEWVHPLQGNPTLCAHGTRDAQALRELPAAHPTGRGRRLARRKGHLFSTMCSDAAPSGELTKVRQSAVLTYYRHVHVQLFSGRNAHHHPRKKLVSDCEPAPCSPGAGSWSATGACVTRAPNF